MTPKDPLLDLKDIALPEPDFLWPLAPGWWALLLLTVMLVIVIAWYLKKHQKKSTTRVDNLQQEFDTIVGRYHQSLHTKRFLLELMTLAKCIGIERFGRQKVASLSGPEWLAFIQKHYLDVSLSDEQARAISSGLYSKDPVLSSDSLIELKNTLVFSMLEDLKHYLKQKGE